MDTVLACFAAGVSVLLFLGSAWLTRAGYWRTASAMMGGLLSAAFAFGLDRAAFEFGWWSYGPMETHAPVAAYATTAFWFGAGIGLIGWRMMRNWGGLGEALFFGGFPLLIVGRDFILAASGSGFSLGDGWLPLAISAAGALAIAFIVQLTMQILVGAIDADELEPERLPVVDPVSWPTDAPTPEARFLGRR